MQLTTHHHCFYHTIEILNERRDCCKQRDKIIRRRVGQGPPCIIWQNKSNGHCLKNILDPCRQGLIYLHFYKGLIGIFRNVNYWPQAPSSTDVARPPAPTNVTSISQYDIIETTASPSPTTNNPSP